jgi:hypothetical protein
LAPYDYDTAAHFMVHLVSTLDAEAHDKVRALGIDVTDAAYMLSNTLPNMTSPSHSI